MKKLLSLFVVLFLVPALCFGYNTRYSEQRILNAVYRTDTGASLGSFTSMSAQAVLNAVFNQTENALNVTVSTNSDIQISTLTAVNVISENITNTYGVNTSTIVATDITTDDMDITYGVLTSTLVATDITAENADITYGVSASTADFSGDIMASSYYGDGQNLTNVGLSTSTAVTFDAYVNETGGITKGQCVYISGETGNRVRVKIADAYSATCACCKTLGIAAETKTNNQAMLLRVTGRLTGIDTSGFTAGDCLYLGGVGNIVNVRPSSGTVQRIGSAEHIDASDGSIITKISFANGYVTARINEEIKLRMGEGSNGIIFEDGYSNKIGTITETGHLYMADTIHSSYGIEATTASFSGQITCATTVYAEYGNFGTLLSHSPLTIEANVVLAPGYTFDVSGSTGAFESLDVTYGIEASTGVFSSSVTVANSLTADTVISTCTYSDDSALLQGGNKTFYTTPSNMLAGTFDADVQASSITWTAGVSRLIAGSNITVSGGTGEITIDASGGSGWTTYVATATLNMNDNDIVGVSSITLLDSGYINYVSRPKWLLRTGSNDGLVIGGDNGSVNHNSVLVGYQAGKDMSAASDNDCVAVGEQAGYKLTSGTKNTIVGQGAGWYIDSGVSNTLIGQAAGDGNGNPSKTTKIGQNVGSNDVNSERVFIDAGSNTNTPVFWADTARNFVVLNSTVSIGTQNSYGGLTVEGDIMPNGTGHSLGDGTNYFYEVHASSYFTHSLKAMATDYARDLIKNMDLEDKSTHGRGYVAEKRYTKIEHKGITPYDVNLSSYTGLVKYYEWDKNKTNPYIEKEIEVVEEAGTAINTIIEALIMSVKDLQAEIDLLKAQ